MENDEALKELINNNPLLANIEGSAPHLPSEEEKQQEKEQERKIEAKQEKMQEIVLEESVCEPTDKPKAHIHSATGKKVREDLKKAKEIRKKHAEKMKQVKGGQFRKNINPAFFSNAKGAVDENKGWAFEFESIKGDPMDKKATIESELKKTEEEKKQEEMKAKEEENKITIKEAEINEIEKRNKEKYLKDGEYVYELFAILVHSGSAYGGHYFAYIKDLTNDTWQSFNDTMVRPIRISEIQRVFGGHDRRSIFHIFTQNRGIAKLYECIYVNV